MHLLSPPAIVLYLLIGLGGIVYLIIRFVIRAGKFLKNGKTEKGWLDQELDAFKKKG